MNMATATHQPDLLIDVEENQLLLLSDFQQEEANELVVALADEMPFAEMPAMARRDDEDEDTDEEEDEDWDDEDDEDWDDEDDEDWDDDDDDWDDDDEDWDDDEDDDDDDDDN